MLSSQDNLTQSFALIIMFSLITQLHSFTLTPIHSLNAKGLFHWLPTYFMTNMNIGKKCYIILFPDEVMIDQSTKSLQPALTSEFKSLVIPNIHCSPSRSQKVEDKIAAADTVYSVMHSEL